VKKRGVVAMFSGQLTGECSVTRTMMLYYVSFVTPAAMREQGTTGGWTASF
jgi:hypothetical protein